MVNYNRQCLPSIPTGLLCGALEKNLMDKEKKESPEYFPRAVFDVVAMAA